MGLSMHVKAPTDLTDQHDKIVLIPECFVDADGRPRASYVAWSRTADAMPNETFVGMRLPSMSGEDVEAVLKAFGPSMQDNRGKKSIPKGALLHRSWLYAVMEKYEPHY